MERGRMRGWMLWRVMPLLISGARAALSPTPRLFQHALRVYNSFPRAHARPAPANEREGLALTSTNRRTESSPRTNKMRQQEEARDVRRSQWEMLGKRGRGEGWRMRGSERVRFFFVCVCERVAGISARERGGCLQERALPPNRFRPGVGRFGLV